MRARAAIGSRVNMRTTRVLLAMGGPVAIAGAMASSSACEHDICSPDDFGIEEPQLLLRALPGIDYAGECKRPRLALISSEEDLRALYDELKLFDPRVSAAEVPTVDFTRERVLLTESDSGEGIQWAVARNQAAIVGLARCLLPANEPRCVVQVRTVPALVSSVESRTCDPVRCSPLRQKAAPRH